MKIRGSILGLVVIAAVLIALVLWYGKKRPMEASPTASVETNAAPPAATAPSQPVSAPLHPNAAATQVASSSAPTATSQPQSPQSPDRETLIKEILQANDADIVFYGRLEDQSGSAVSGAAVNFSIQYKDANGRDMQRGQVVSDANGLFTISGYRGANLGIMPKKVGYALSTTSTSFRYSQLTPGYFVPDAGNPTVIKMWKLQGAEPLVGINKTFKIPYTGPPINFDLLTGQIVPAGGDIKLTVSRSAGVMSGRNRLDWSVQVEAVNGGVMDAGGQEGVTYAAPQDGYQPSMVFAFSANTPPYKWAGGFDQGFFIQSRNGQVYSKLGLGFEINIAPDDFMYVTFSGVASTNGSRNWEATVPQ